MNAEALNLLIENDLPAAQRGDLFRSRCEKWGAIGCLVLGSTGVVIGLLFSGKPWL